MVQSIIQCFSQIRNHTVVMTKSPGSNYCAQTEVNWYLYGPPFSSASYARRPTGLWYGLIWSVNYKSQYTHAMPLNIYSISIYPLILLRSNPSLLFYVCSSLFCILFNWNYLTNPTTPASVYVILILRIPYPK